MAKVGGMDEEKGGNCGSRSGVEICRTLQKANFKLREVHRSASTVYRLEKGFFLRTMDRGPILVFLPEMERNPGFAQRLPSFVPVSPKNFTDLVSEISQRRCDLKSGCGCNRGLPRGGEMKEDGGNLARFSLDNHQWFQLISCPRGGEVWLRKIYCGSSMDVAGSFRSSASFDGISLKSP